MVNQIMLRTHEGKLVFWEKKNPICDCTQYDQMPSIDLTTGIVPYVPTYF